MVKGTRLNSKLIHWKHIINEFIENLVTKPGILAKAKAIVAEHFEFLNIILKISFSEALEQGYSCPGRITFYKIIQRLS